MTITTSEAAELAMLRDEIDRLREMVRWSYSKLHQFSFSKQEDALQMDEIKLYLEHGI